MIKKRNTSKKEETLKGEEEVRPKENIVQSKKIHFIIFLLPVKRK